MNNDIMLIGVDVGSGSARAGVFDAKGNLLAHASHKITLYHESGNQVEQSSPEIWSAVCACVKEAVGTAGIPPSSVAGIGFDATCSLVVLGPEGQPLPVGKSEDPERNIIVWMDHRATLQAERINSTQHPVLRHVGERISPEMETPKLLWLKENRRDVYDSAWQFFDLVDFLTWRATGDLARSACTVTCKWTYLAHEQRWDPDYFRAIGLNDLADDDFVRIGQRILMPGTSCGQGLTAQASAELGLPVGTPVAIGLIDAHAGGIGTVGVNGDVTKSLGYVFGTSSCTMTTTSKPTFIPGVWGPYYSAMIPNLWLNEGGQNAAGAAIERLLARHPATPEAQKLADMSGVSLPVWLADRALEQAGTASRSAYRSAFMNVVPEFQGNRSPFADPDARAIISGIGMEQDIDSLIDLYIAGICGIGYGLKQILNVQSHHGVNIENIVISGGAGRHSLVRQLIADTCGLPVISTRSHEPVLLGSAILAKVASGLATSLENAMDEMVVQEQCYEPTTDKIIMKLHSLRQTNWTLLQQSAVMLRKMFLSTFAESGDVKTSVNRESNPDTENAP